MGRDQEDQALLDVVDDPPALAQAVHQRRERVVPEDQVGRLARHGRARSPSPPPTSARLRAGASLTPSPVTATVRPARGRPGPAVPCPRASTGRRPAGCRSSAASSASSQDSRVRPDDDIRPLQAGLVGDRRRGRRMVAGHDDRLDAGHAGRRQRLADAVAERVGEPDERSHLGRAVALAAGEADGPLPGRRGALDQDLPRGPRHARPAGFGENGLRRADRGASRPGRHAGPGCGRTGGHRRPAPHRGARRDRGAPPPASSTARIKRRG